MHASNCGHLQANTQPAATATHPSHEMLIDLYMTLCMTLCTTVRKAHKVAHKLHVRRVRSCDV